MKKGISKHYKWRIVKVHYEKGVDGKSGDCYALQQKMRGSWIFGDWYDCFWGEEKLCEERMRSAIEYDNRERMKVTYSN